MEDSPIKVSENEMPWEVSESHRKTIALAVVQPVQFTATKDSDALHLRVDPVGFGPIVEIPISTESMDSLDPLLDAIAEGEYLSLEIVKYE